MRSFLTFIGHPPRADYLDLCEPAMDTYRAALAPLDAEARALQDQYADQLQLNVDYYKLKRRNLRSLRPLSERMEAMMDRSDEAEDELCLHVDELLKGYRDKRRRDSTWTGINDLIYGKKRTLERLHDRVDKLTRGQFGWGSSRWRPAHDQSSHPSEDYIDVCKPQIAAFRDKIEPLLAEAQQMRAFYEKRLQWGRPLELVKRMQDLKLIPLIEPAKKIVDEVRRAQRQLWKDVDAQLELKRCRSVPKIRSTREKIRKIIKDETLVPVELFERAEMLVQPIRRRDRGEFNDRDDVNWGQPGIGSIAYAADWHDYRRDWREDVLCAHAKMRDALDEGVDEGRALEELVQDIEKANEKYKPYLWEYIEYRREMRSKLADAKDELEDYRKQFPKEHSAPHVEESVAKRWPVVLGAGAMSERTARRYNII